MSGKYLEYLANIKPPLLEGAADIICYLEKLTDIWFVTNGDSKVQHKKMLLSDLSHLKDRITVSDDVGFGKPHAKIFLHALEAAGHTDTNPSEIIMIGDNLEADILGGAAMGFSTIWYDPSHTESQYPGKRVTHLSEIRNILT